MSWSAELVSLRNKLSYLSSDPRLIEGASCLHAVALARTYGRAETRLPWADTEVLIRWQEVQRHLSTVVQLLARPQGDRICEGEGTPRGQD